MDENDPKTNDTAPEPVQDPQPAPEPTPAPATDPKPADSDNAPAKESAPAPKPKKPTLRDQLTEANNELEKLRKEKADNEANHRAALAAIEEDKKLQSELDAARKEADTLRKQIADERAAHESELKKAKATALAHAGIPKAIPTSDSNDQMTFDKFASLSSAARLKIKAENPALYKKLTNNS